MLVQIFQMRQETLMFSNKETPLAKISSDITWPPYHAYLANIWDKTKKLPFLSMSMALDILKTEDKMSAIKTGL